MGYANFPNAYEMIKFNMWLVRKKLEKHTVGSNPDNPGYAGLCYQATSMFLEEMKESCEKRGIPLKFKSIHGEQRHNPNLHSTKWHFQHQWCWVDLLGKRYYVDCTCGQFKDLYDDIPDYYISIKKPKWFLDDRKNIAFNGFTKWLNQKIIIRRRVVLTDMGKTEVHDGIIEFIQYEIWGPISDFIRKILGRDRK